MATETKSTSVWGAGAWAAEAEEEEKLLANAAKSAVNAPPVDTTLFPSLSEALKAPGGSGAGGGKSKKEKKKATTISLQEFNTLVATPAPYARGGPPVGSEVAGLTVDEMIMLPKGPREREEDEKSGSGLGGGFRNYGGMRGLGGGDRRDREDRRGNDEREASRADESADWGAGRKFTPSSAGGGYPRDRERGESGGYRKAMGEDRERSVVDDVDDWTAGKKFVPSGASAGGPGGFGGPRSSFRGAAGYEESNERGGGSRGFDRPAPHSKADDVDNWSTAKKFEPTRGAAAPSSDIDADRWTRRGPPAPPADAPSEREGGGERKRLVLQKRSVPLDAAPPASEAPSGSAAANVAGEKKPSPFGNAKPKDIALEKPKEEGVVAVGGPREEGEKREERRPKSNPFGDARPREVLLEEKGKDWKIMDLALEHRAVDRPDSEEEKRLKGRIDELKVSLQGASEATASGKGPVAVSNQEDLRKQISSLELELTQLMLRLDDEVRYHKPVLTSPGKVLSGATSNAPPSSHQPVSAVAATAKGGVLSTATAGTGTGLLPIASTGPPAASASAMVPKDASGPPKAWGGGGPRGPPGGSAGNGPVAAPLASFAAAAAGTTAGAPPVGPTTAAPVAPASAPILAYAPGQVGGPGSGPASPKQRSAAPPNAWKRPNPQVTSGAAKPSAERW